MLNLEQPYEGPERRATGRFPTALAVTIRETGKNSLPGTVVSLSHLGCTVTGVTSFGEGSVWIRLPGLESQLAKRRWATQGSAGFEFEHPLYPPVADRFNGNRPVVQRPTLSLVEHTEELPGSRREQILHGRAEVPQPLTMTRRPRSEKPTLRNIVRRHSARVVDQRHEARFPPPDEAQLGFRVADRPAQLNDISSSGVQVGAELAGGIGAKANVSFAGFTPLPGTIVWVRQGATGLRLPDNALDLEQDN